MTSLWYHGNSHKSRLICKFLQISDVCHRGIDNMNSREIARSRIIDLIDAIYDSYKEFEEELGYKKNTVTEWKRGVSYIRYQTLHCY